jgi:mRNA-degrading endonuclease RelE of RelBE toxin-antitoxin system
MITEFLVSTTSRFDRELKKLAGQHSGLLEVFRRVINILKEDPYNRSHQHPIKKLEAVAAGEGQYRVRSGRFRFRYDISDRVVSLKACSLRREDSYR